MKLIKILILLFFITKSFSQQSITQKVETLANSDYFHSFKIEKFFIHTNKTVYFSGEKIWFKAYIVEDDSNTPFIETTNVYVNLYNENFELVSSHLFYAENGKTYGEILLPKDLKSSNYYLQLDTQWNKNFNRQYVFPIQIIDLKDTESVNFKHEAPYKDIDFSILDFNVKSFKINKIESVNEKSLTFQINTTSDAINKNLNGTIAYTVLHREGSLRSIAPLKLKQEKTSYKINFSKTDLFNGLNTITLFDLNNNPIAESNFFYNANRKIDVKIENDFVTHDTLTINLKIFGDFKKANISVTVLPEESSVNNNSSNIVSSYLLQPYIKYDIYYFNKHIQNGEKLDELVQLKSKKDVFVYKSLSNRKMHFTNEAGVSLSGKVTAKTKNLSNLKVMLSSTENKITEITNIDSEHNFKFDRLLLQHPTKYSLSLLDKKGKIDKAYFFVYSTYVNYRASNNLNVTNNFKAYTQQIDSINKTIKNTDSFTFPEYADAEVLDEVNLTVYKKKKELELRKKLKKSGILGLNGARVFKPEDSGFNHGSLMTYLQTLPSTTIIYNTDGLPILKNDRGRRSLSDPEIRPITIIYNGATLYDLSVIQYLNADDIDYVVLNINGAGYGSIYPNGVLHLVSKKGVKANSKRNINYNIQENDTKYGFNITKGKYELPELNFSSQKSIDNFSTIDWIPDFDIKPNSDNLLKINRKYYNNFKLIINGLTDDGIPFFKIHHIKLKSN